MRNRHYGRRRLLALAVIGYHAPASFAAEEGARHVTFEVGDRLTREDNLYRLPAWLDPRAVLSDDASAADMVNSASLAVAGRWSQGEQGLSLDANFASNRFARNDDLDNVSGRAALEWEWRFGGRWSGSFGAQREQALASFANTASLERDLLDTRAYVGNVSLALGARVAAFLRTRAAATGHENELRRRDDSEQRSAAFGFAYESPRESTLAWEVRDVRATFPEQALEGGAVNDYDERASSLEVGYVLTEKVRLDASAGYVRRTYALAERGNFDGAIWNVALEWAPTPAARLAFARFRDVRAHLDVETNHFVTTGESVAATWAPLAELVLTLQVAREDQRYIGAAVLDEDTRRDAPTTAGFMAVYTPRERLSLEVTIRDERRESNNARFDYAAGGASVGVEVRF
jgi:hypothetical protein